jgi:hypothetical protein
LDRPAAAGLLHDLLEQFHRQMLPALSVSRITHPDPVQLRAVISQCAARLQLMEDQATDEVARWRACGRYEDAARSTHTVF